MLSYRFRIFISVICAMICTIIICSPSWGQEGGKVAVLSFANSSGFDSSSGCLSVWPMNVIFGSGHSGEKWDISAGFRDMLNEKLIAAGYSIVEPDLVDEALQSTGKKDMAALVRELDADILIVGDIRKFDQHRMRASSQGPTRLNSGSGMQLSAMGGVGGYYYSATVKTDIAMYDNSGDKVESGEVNSKKDLRDFYMGVGLMTYHRGDMDEGKDGTKPQNPIVDYGKLDKMKFGSDEFNNKTLFGMTTMDVMDQIVTKIERYLSPAELATAQGKIIYIGTGDRLKENEVYINLGAGDELKTGQRLGIFIKGIQLIDPDTGEELGSIAEKKVGVIRISKVEAEHLSIAEVIEKTGEIERGNVVKREQGGESEQDD